MPSIKLFIFRTLLWGSAVGVASHPCFGAVGTVYLVVGSDTAIWNAVTTVDVYARHPHYQQDSFTASNAPIFQLMDPAWRDQFKDSFGQPIKFTWWMMGGNIYRAADNLNVPLPNTMTLHLMKQYHGQAIRQFGDELSLHYHTYEWTDYSGTGVYYWNQARGFEDCRADFDVTLAQYLLEEGVFPVSFRSGWHFMDQEWQAYLNELIPYCFHDNYPAKIPWYTNSGPIAGVEDWSHAPPAFVPFHPSTNDYQIPGDGPGWNVRSVKIQALTQGTVDQMFSQASAGEDQVACFWDHLPENFVANIARLGSLLAQAGSSNPAVQFRYCTAVEAMQRWRGLTNLLSPVLEVGQTVQNQTVTIAITSSASLFQARPFVCLRDVFQQYQNVTAACAAVSSNTWRVTLPVRADLLAKVGIALTDEAGNLVSRILRYVPDDLYLDNSGPQYSEGQGTWTTTTNASWGTDARVAPLASGTTAEATWNLPVAGAGAYWVSAQVPSLTNAATNVVFHILTQNTNVLSVTFPAGLATNQWTFIGSVLLEPSLSNRVQLAVDGANQADRSAVADVIRVIPAPEAAFAAINPVDPVQFLATPLGYVLRFPVNRGKQYTLQRSDNALAGWTTLEIAEPASAGYLEYQEENALPGQAFYRILSQ